MKHAALATAVLILMASLAQAATNLNSSKSNIYRVIHDDFVTPAQADAIVADLKTPMDEAALKQALPQILKKNGVDPNRVRKMLILHGDKEPKTSVILLGNAQNESAAIELHEREQGRKHTTGVRYK